MNSQSGRIGIDIGGTFTDLIFDDGNGDTTAIKVSTNPEYPDQGCLEAIKATGLTNLKDISYFLNATTVGLNALLERRGATVGLLTTLGFRDTLVIGRGDRARIYDIKWSSPEPLVQRKLRVGIEERILYNGKIHIKLNQESVRNALEIFNQSGVNSIAVVYLNSYANPVHELETSIILRRAGFDGEISLSHQITSEYREYERTTTTVIDAFVSGRMRQYFHKTETHLRKRGFNGSLLITKSGGGAMTFKEASAGFSETIMSGPVAGAEGAAELSRKLDLGDLITADVGGTSFDTCIVKNGRPNLMYQGQIIDMPIQIPWIDVRSIGAGGGSIAYLDEGGLLKVGPKSAGANPGPACYKKGGSKPTVTDAAFVLGMLGKGSLASGFSLDRNRSLKSLKPLAKNLKITIEKVAVGILRIAITKMTNAIKEITVENGIDPREMKLLAYGGAGPLFAGLIAEELRLKNVVIPPFAGNFSAWGLLGADISYTKSQTKKITLTPQCLPLINIELARLFEGLKSEFNNEKEIHYEVFLDLRYKGQEHAITLTIENDLGMIAGSSDTIAEQFQKAYYDIYNTNLSGVIEVVSIRTTLRKPLADRKIQLNHKHIQSSTETTKAYSFLEDRMLDFKLTQYDQLEVNKIARGPLILADKTSTAYIDVNTKIVLDESGCLFITKDLENE